MEFIHFEASDGNENNVDFNVENKVGDDLISFIDNSERNENVYNYYKFDVTRSAENALEDAFY